MTRKIYSDMTACDYCGASKNGLSFAIGAAKRPDWTMVEGTGKMTCPDCFDKATQEGQDAIKRHTGL
mgnify:CR=1 FL=1